MRALLVSCVFPPEPVTSAATSRSLARELSNRGHEVTVITSYPNRPGGRLFPGFRRRLFGRSREDGGIDVVRCFCTTSRTASLVSRLFENLSFGVSGGLMVAMLRRPDVIYANTWPIFALGIMTLIARFRRIPIIVSVQDVYPESLFSLGKLRKDGILGRLLRFIDAYIAQRASDVVVISPRVKQIYSGDRKIPAERLHLIANWRDSEELPDRETVRRRRDGWGIGPSTFLFLFAGNVAASCGIESVIDAISILPPEPSARFLVAGSGSALEKCRGVASCLEGDRTVFTGAFLAQETLPILTAADVLILPTQGDQSLVSMPSKLISYLLAARPVLAVVRSQSDLANVILEAGCGWVVEPGDTAELAKQMSVAAAMDRSALMRIGMLGREYALAHFSTEACLPKVIGVIEKAMLGERRKSPGKEARQGQPA